MGTTSPLPERLRSLAAEVGVETTPSNFVRRDTLFFNALDHGVVADRTVDSTAAFQDLLDQAAGRGTILIPAGDYGSRELIFPANTIISGYGATIHRVGTGSMARNWPDGDTTTGGYDGHGSITIHGLTFDHHGDEFEGNGNTVAFNHALDIKLRDCGFLRSRGYHALELNAIKRGTVDNCLFAGHVAHPTLTDREAIQIDVAYPGDSGMADGTMAEDIKIIDCRFEPLGDLPAHQVAIGSHTRAPGKLYKNIEVRGCTGRGQTLRFINADYWGEGCIIEGVIADGEGITEEGIRARHGAEIKITTCTMSRMTKQGYLLSNMKRSRVVGSSAIECHEGFYDSDGSEGNVFGGNNIYRSKSYATVSNSCKDTLWTGNYIEGAGYPNGGWGSMRVTGTAKDIGFTGNMVRPHGAGTEMAAAVAAASTSSGTWVFGNDFKGMVTAVAGPATASSNRI